VLVLLFICLQFVLVKGYNSLSSRVSRHGSITWFHNGDAPYLWKCTLPLVYNTQLFFPVSLFLIIVGAALNNLLVADKFFPTT
jgi:hypothetical protein